MKIYSVGSSPTLIELKFILGSPNNIYFHIKQVLADHIAV